MFIPPVAIIRRKHIVKRLLFAGAVSVDTAKTLDEVGIFKGSGLMISRLEAHGILVKADNERYYVDVNKHFLF